MSDSAGQQDAARESALLRLVAPAKPSRGRLIALWLILVIWILALIVLYFVTIRPRHPAPPERGLAAAPSPASPLIAAR